jgi:hypothetical protein
MSERATSPSGLARFARRTLFVGSLACTLWLVIENSILLVLISHTAAAGALRLARGPAPIALAWGLAGLLVPLAFGLGWLASRGSLRASRSPGERA